MRARSRWGLVAALTAIVASSSVGAAQSPAPAASPAGYSIGIVEQQLSNPFFGALAAAAQAEAAKYGIDVITAESKTAGDAATQVTAIQDMINRGVKGISLDPGNAAAVVAAVKQAMDAGILVVAVNTETDPQDSVAATFETDNLAGGKLMGQWAKAKLGATPARVALLDYDLTDKTSKARHDGFLAGFGLTDTSPEIAGEVQTQANADSGRTAMENLLSANPDINVVYTINEPMAVGAAAAIKAANLGHDVIVVSIDGSCAGVQAVKDGQIGATVMQFPSKMGQMAVDAIKTYVETGAKPTGIIDTGTTLITDATVEGITAQTTDWGLQNCWGAAQ
jgi:fructose transport system substrate-binding protein